MRVLSLSVSVAVTSGPISAQYPSVRDEGVREGCAEVCQRLCGMCRVNFPKNLTLGTHSVKLKVKRRARIASPLRAKSVRDLSAGASCNSSIVTRARSLLPFEPNGEGQMRASEQ